MIAKGKPLVRVGHKAKGPWTTKFQGSQAAKIIDYLWPISLSNAEIGFFI